MKKRVGGGKAAPRAGWLLTELGLGLAVAGLWSGLALVGAVASAQARARAGRERTAFLLARGIAAELSLGLGRTRALAPRPYLSLRSGARDVRRVGLDRDQERRLAGLMVEIELRGPCPVVTVRGRGVAYTLPEVP